MNTRNFFKTLIGAAGGAIAARFLPAAKAIPAAPRMEGWPTPSTAIGGRYIRPQVFIRQNLAFDPTTGKFLVVGKDSLPSTKIICPVS